MQEIVKGEEGKKLIEKCLAEDRHVKQEQELMQSMSEDPRMYQKDHRAADYVPVYQNDQARYASYPQQQQTRAYMFDQDQ